MRRRPRLPTRRLKVSEPTDALERQADQVANFVTGPSQGAAARTIADGGALRIGGGGAQPGPLRPVAQGNGATLNRQAAPGSGGGWLGKGFASRLGAARAKGGEPLPVATRAEFEPKMGEDLSGVRVHHDGEASALAREASARAFTVGSDVFFGKGEFRPGTSDGKRLIAHEAAHVGQQGRGALGIQRQPLPGAPATGPIAESAECPGVPPNAAFQGCDVLKPKPHGDLPPQEQWATNPTLNKIRSEPIGSNKTLLSRGRGSRGEAVGLVQQAILSWGCREKELNVLPRSGADKSFGGETDAAARKFQCEEGIKVDGIVGPETMGKLDEFAGGTGSECAEGEPVVVGGGGGPLGARVLGAFLPGMFCRPKPAPSAPVPKLRRGDVTLAHSDTDFESSSFIALGTTSHDVRSEFTAKVGATVEEPPMDRFEYGLVQNLMFDHTEERYEKGDALIDTVGPLVDVGQGETPPFIHDNEVPAVLPIGSILNDPTVDTSFSDRPLLPVQPFGVFCKKPVRLSSVVDSTAFRVGFVARNERTGKLHVLGVVEKFYGLRIEVTLDWSENRRSLKFDHDITGSHPLVPTKKGQNLKLTPPTAVSEAIKNRAAEKAAMASRCGNVLGSSATVKIDEK